MHVYNTIPSVALIGDAQVEHLVLEDMRGRMKKMPEAKWAAFQNHDLGHHDIGHLKFMAVGPGRTYGAVTQPMDWRYRFVGFVNLDSGAIEPAEV